MRPTATLPHSVTELPVFLGTTIALLPWELLPLGSPDVPASTTSLSLGCSLLSFIVNLTQLAEISQL